MNMFRKRRSSTPYSELRYAISAVTGHTRASFLPRGTTNDPSPPPTVFSPSLSIGISSGVLRTYGGEVPYTALRKCDEKDATWTRSPGTTAYGSTPLGFPQFRFDCCILHWLPFDGWFALFSWAGRVARIIWEVAMTYDQMNPSWSASISILFSFVCSFLSSSFKQFYCVH